MRSKVTAHTVIKGYTYGHKGLYVQTSYRTDFSIGRYVKAAWFHTSGVGR